MSQKLKYGVVQMTLNFEIEITSKTALCFFEYLDSNINSSSYTLQLSPPLPIDETTGKTFDEVVCDFSGYDSDQVIYERNRLLRTYIEDMIEEICNEMRRLARDEEGRSYCYCSGGDWSNVPFFRKIAYCFL